MLAASEKRCRRHFKICDRAPSCSRRRAECKTLLLDFAEIEYGARAGAIGKGEISGTEQPAVLQGEMANRRDAVAQREGVQHRESAIGGNPVHRADMTIATICGRAVKIAGDWQQRIEGNTIGTDESMQRREGPVRSEFECRKYGAADGRAIKIARPVAD